MKILLLLLLLPITIQAVAQSAEEQIERGKSFLQNDPCNYTGLSWIEGALKSDPENQEAKTLIENCYEIKRVKARQLLTERPDNSEGKRLAEELVAKYPKDEEFNYLLAKAYMVDRPNHIAKSYISAAIEANPTNPEYRWIRVRCNMLSSSRLEDFQVACDDLNSMIQNGAESAKVYANLSEAEFHLANQWKRKPVMSNTGWQDENSQQKFEESEKTKYVVLHLENARSAAHKAIDMDEAYKGDLTYRIESINKELAEIKTEHSLTE